jgi:hypothetical protein
LVLSAREFAVLSREPGRKEDMKDNNAHREPVRTDHGEQLTDRAQSLITQAETAVKNWTPVLAVLPLMQVLELAHKEPGKLTKQGLTALGLLNEIRQQDPDMVDREWKRIVDGGDDLG